MDDAFARAERLRERALGALPEDSRARWAAIPGVFAKLYRDDERLMIAGFQAHAQQGIAALLAILSRRRGSGFVDLEQSLLAVYSHFLPALLAWRGGGIGEVRSLRGAVPAGVVEGLERVGGGEVSAGNLDLLWSEQPMVQERFYGRHPVLAWSMTRGARLDFGSARHVYAHRCNPFTSLGREAHRVAWDRELWRGWEEAQGNEAQLARIDDIIARGRAAGAVYDL